MIININYPIVRDGYDTDGTAIRYAKFKRRGDFIITLTGDLGELESINLEMKSIIQKTTNRIKCAKDFSNA